MDLVGLGGTPAVPSQHCNRLPAHRQQSSAAGPAQPDLGAVLYPNHQTPSLARPGLGSPTPPKPAHILTRPPFPHPHRHPYQEPE